MSDDIRAGPGSRMALTYLATKGSHMQGGIAVCGIVGTHCNPSTQQADGGGS